MADELTPSFNIQDTMSMGIGDAQLLTNLFEEEGKETLITPKEEPKEKEKKEEPKKEEPKKETPKKDFLKDYLSKEEDKEIEEEEDKEKETEEGFQFNSLAKDLHRLGIFTSEEGETEDPIETPEQFLDRFNKEKQKGAMIAMNSFIGQFGEDYQKAFESIFVKGVNPKDFFTTYNSIENLAEIDLSKENNQIAVVKQALIDQEFEDEDIATEIERLKQYGDLEKVATKHHKVLLKKETNKLQQMEQVKERELQEKTAYKQQYSKNVQDVLIEKLKTKEFDGIPINSKLAGEIQEYLLVDKYKTATGETLTEFDKAILDLKKPENHTKKVKFALLMKTLEKDPTLSTIQRTAITKQTNQLFEEVTKQKGVKTEKEKKETQPTSWWVK